MRILVVDDERDYGFLLFHLLSRLGHEPVLAFDPGDALDIVQGSEPVAAVITDIDMPGMTGVELAQRIRASYGAIPIAFCTGSDPRGETATTATAIGPVLRKGDSIEHTRERIREFIRTLAAPPAAH
jgi:CheY-like chemotaxis protein